MNKTTEEQIKEMKHQYQMAAMNGQLWSDPEFLLQLDLFDKKLKDLITESNKAYGLELLEKSFSELLVKSSYSENSDLDPRPKMVIDEDKIRSIYHQFKSELEKESPSPKS